MTDSQPPSTRDPAESNQFLVFSERYRAVCQRLQDLETGTGPTDSYGADMIAEWETLWDSFCRTPPTSRPISCPRSQTPGL